MRAEISDRVLTIRTVGGAHNASDLWREALRYGFVGSECGTLKAIELHFIHPVGYCGEKAHAGG